MTSPTEITVDPDPPEAGEPCKIGHSGPFPVTLRYKIDNGAWVEFQLTATSTTLEIEIPRGATSLQIEDLTGGAPYRDLPVT